MSFIVAMVLLNIRLLIGGVHGSFSACSTLTEQQMAIFLSSKLRLLLLFKGAVQGVATFF